MSKDSDWWTWAVIGAIAVITALSIWIPILVPQLNDKAVASSIVLENRNRSRESREEQGHTGWGS